MRISGYLVVCVLLFFVTCAVGAAEYVVDRGLPYIILAVLLAATLNLIGQWNLLRLREAVDVRQIRSIGCTAIMAIVFFLGLLFSVGYFLLVRVFCLVHTAAVDTYLALVVYAAIHIAACLALHWCLLTVLIARAEKKESEQPADKQSKTPS